MTAAQLTAFEAQGGFKPAQMANLLLSLLFVLLLLWGTWAIRSAYNAWVEQRLSTREFFEVVMRFFALYLLLTYFLLS